MTPLWHLARISDGVFSLAGRPEERDEARYQAMFFSKEWVKMSYPSIAYQ